jgi:hypothetical protein
MKTKKLFNYAIDYQPRSVENLGGNYFSTRRQAERACRAYIRWMDEGSRFPPDRFHPNMVAEVTDIACTNKYRP